MFYHFRSYEPQWYKLPSFFTWIRSLLISNLDPHTPTLSSIHNKAPTENQLMALHCSKSSNDFSKIKGSKFAKALQDLVPYLTSLALTTSNISALHSLLLTVS